MIIGNQACTPIKDTTFKVKKQDDSDTDLTGALELLLVRKMKNQYQGKPKCFSCGQLGHFVAKCPYTDLMIMRKLFFFKRHHGVKIKGSILKKIELSCQKKTPMKNLVIRIGKKKDCLWLN